MNTTLRLLIASFALCLFIKPAILAGSPAPYAPGNSNVRPAPRNEFLCDRGSGNKKSTTLAVLAGGLLPGAGQLYLGNYCSGLFQLSLFSSALYLAAYNHGKSDYIKYRDREVSYNFPDAIAAQELRNRGLLYGNSVFPPLSETEFERKIRLLRRGRLGEESPLVKYGTYRRTTYSTVNFQMYSGLAAHTWFYSIYSSYRDSGAIHQAGTETISDLTLAPFKKENLFDIRVMGPAIVFGLIAYGGARNKSIPMTLAVPGMKKRGHLAGAYGMVMASNYNMRPRPAEVLVRDGTWAIVREWESWDDLIRHELLRTKVLSE